MKIRIYQFRTCTQCVSYVEGIRALAEHYGYKFEICYIEEAPLVAYNALTEARKAGSWVTNSPFITLTKNDIYYKAIDGVVELKHIEKLLKRYAKTT